MARNGPAAGPPSDLSSGITQPRYRQARLSCSGPLPGGYHRAAACMPRLGVAERGVATLWRGVAPPESGKVPCTLLLHAGIGVLDGHNGLLPCVARLGVHRRRVIWICSHRRPLIRAVDGQGGGAVSAASPSAYGLILASCEYLGSTRGQCASWWAGVKWGASNSGRVETCTNGTPHYWTMTFLQ